jgi:hypothetical protein
MNIDIEKHNMIQLIPKDEIIITSYWKEITKAHKYEASDLSPPFREE